MDTNTAITTTGNVVLTSTGNVTITVSGQNILFDIANRLSSLANTSAGSTLTGGLIFQPGANLGLTISGSQFVFTSTAAGGGGANTQPSFHAFLGADLTIAANVDTKVTFNTAEAATNIRGMFVTATTRAIPSLTGVCIFTAHTRGRALYSMTTMLYKNGALFNRLLTNNVGNGLAGSAMDRVTAITDFYEINVINSGSAMDLAGGAIGTSWFQGCRISDN